MKLLKDYFKLQQKIYDYFGYQEDWMVLPIDDATEYYWREDGSRVLFSTTREGVDDEEGSESYENEIFTYRHLSKWVYRGKDYTMICVDTHTDGNKFLQVFDNAKELR